MKARLKKTKGTKVVVTMSKQEADELYDYLEGKTEQEDNKYHGKGAGEYFNQLHDILGVVLAHAEEGAD